MNQEIAKKYGVVSPNTCQILEAVFPSTQFVWLIKERFSFGSLQKIKEVVGLGFFKKGDIELLEGSVGTYYIPAPQFHEILPMLGKDYFIYSKPSGKEFLEVDMCATLLELEIKEKHYAQACAEMIIKRNEYKRNSH